MYREHLLLRLRILLSNQIFGSMLKVVEAVLLAGQTTGLVPFLAVFATATNVGNRHDTIHVTKKCQPCRAEHGREGDVETSVAIEQRRIVPI